jgi:uncharacterized protein (TIGR03437 family)
MLANFRMRWFSRLVTVVLGAITVSAQPSVTAALNAAGYQQPPNGDPAIAQGSIFVVFGTNLGGAGLVQASGFPLRESIPGTGGTSVAVTSGNQTVAAYMVYASATQVAAILPSGTPVGPATVTVAYQGQTSPPAHIQVVRAAPGVFTRNAKGTGPAVAQVAFSSTDVRLNNFTTPAAPGSVLVVYGTGFGGIAGDDSVPPGAIQSGKNVRATIGGKPATVLYAGRAPEFPGLDQVNLQLAPDLPLGCYTPGVISIDDIPGNQFVLSTAAAGSQACTHPFGLDAAAEAKVDAGGSVNVAAFTVAKATIEKTSAEGLAGRFAAWNGDQLFEGYAALLRDLRVVAYPAPVDGCVVYDELVASTPATMFSDSVVNLGGSELQSAPSLTLDGYIPGLVTTSPVSISQSISRAGGDGAGYEWTKTLVGPSTPAILGYGNWSLLGDAGPDVKAFSASVGMIDLLTWTGMTGLNAPARSGVTVTWSGGICAEPSCPKNLSTPYVNIFGNSSVYNAADPSKNRGKSFVCAVQGAATIYTIPLEVTTALPAAGSGETGVGFLGISSSGTAPMAALLTGGDRLDGGVIGYSYFSVNSGPSFGWR